MGAAFEQFLKYKNRVPVRGAIMLTDKMDEVLLVKGWKKSGTWSFPRGKINKEESDLDCAVREAWEETGFDLRAANMLDGQRKPYPIDQTIRSQSITLFVFRGVPRDAIFMPQTRKEISKIEWYKLSDLPTLKKKQTHQEGTINANKFYMVAPFMGQLKKYIATERRRDKRLSSNPTVPNLAVDSAAFDEEQQYAVPEYAEGPLSPPLPSSLPEVTPSAMQDPALLLKQQLNIGSFTQPQVTAKVDVVKSNALLAMLRGGSAVEMRNDPPTPLEQTASTHQLQPSQHTIHPLNVVNMQSPLPVFDTQQQSYLLAPPPSALPQLSQHRMSLLQAFQKDGPQSQAAEARRNLTAPKQDLLTALMSPKPAITSIQPSVLPARGPANDLLALLQTKQVSADAAMQGVLPETQMPPPASQTVTTSLSAPRVSSPPPNILSQTLLSGSTSNKQNSRAYETNANTDAEAPGAIPLPNSGSKSIPRNQAEPVELSAIAETTNKAPAVDKTKADLLSLLGSMPPKVAKVAEKPGAGSTAATLSGPINEPQFDAIPKVSIQQEEIRRDPVTTPRKLFDPKHDDPKRPANVQVLSRQDDRSRPPKSPRTIKHKQDNSARRPITPKELQKPFQPQILKRPQTAEGEPPQSPFSLLARPATVDPGAGAKTAPSVEPLAEPSSPSLDEPHPILAQSHVELSKPSRNASQVQDPQREALLSLLKAPTSKATSDADVTPKVLVPTMQPQPQPQPQPQSQPSQDSIISPTTPSQLVSPVMDDEPQQGASRSRVSSLASMGNGFTGVVGTKPHTEKRQTTASDKAFLMNYLKGFAT